MKKPIVAIINILAFLSFLQGCKCSGVDEHIYYYAMDIEKDHDTAYKKDGAYKHMLFLSYLSRSEEGNKKGTCLHKTYSFAYKEEIDTNSLIVYCNKPLKNESEVIGAGSNIYHTFHRSGYDLFITADSIDKGQYTYYVSGSTTLGNTFIDSTTVIYE